MADPPIIDHNPHERRLTNRIWWIIWPIVALLWVGQVYSGKLDWDQICLGGLTMGVLVIWAMEMTGNKVPESWTRNLRRKR